MITQLKQSDRGIHIGMQNTQRIFKNQKDSFNRLKMISSYTHNTYSAVYRLIHSDKKKELQLEPSPTAQTKSPILFIFRSIF